MQIFRTLAFSLFSFCSNHTATQPHNFATSRPHYSTGLQSTKFFYGNPKLNVISHRCNHFNSKLLIKTLIFHLPCVWILLRETGDHGSYKVEEYQARREALAGLRGLVNIADVLIYGCGTIQEEAEKDHEENLYNFLLRMQQVKLKLNPAKWKFKTPKMIFISFQLSPEGVSPAPTLDKAISRMPKPAY